MFEKTIIYSSILIFLSVPLNSNAELIDAKGENSTCLRIPIGVNPDRAELPIEEIRKLGQRVLQKIDEFNAILGDFNEEEGSKEKLVEKLVAMNKNLLSLKSLLDNFNKRNEVLDYCNQQGSYNTVAYVLQCYGHDSHSMLLYISALEARLDRQEDDNLSCENRIRIKKIFTSIHEYYKKWYYYVSVLLDIKIIPEVQGYMTTEEFINRCI